MAQLIKNVYLDHGTSKAAAKALALNAIGLSTQVSMVIMYQLDGAARTIMVEKQKIIFKKTTPKNYAAIGQICIEKNCPEGSFLLMINLEHQPGSSSEKLIELD